MLFRLYSLLRRFLYFLLGQRRFKVWVNTHLWAWFVPEGDSINLPVINEEITDAFYLNEPGIQKAVAILRANFPQAKFTPASWQSENAWNTRTFNDGKIRGGRFRRVPGPNRASPPGNLAQCPKCL